MKALESLLPPNVVEAIGGTLMHAFWQLAALALALMLVLALVSRRAAQTRYWLGVSTMGLMLLLPIATFVYLYEPAPAQPDGLTLVSSSSTASSANFRQPAFRPLPPITPSMTPRHGEGIMEEVSAFVQANAYLLVGLWLLGMGFFALRFAGGYWRVQRLRKQGLSPVDADLQSRFASLVARMGFRRPIVLLQSTLIDTPLVIGVFKPMVLLPVGLLTGLSMEQVECVLVHELAHVRRWDFLVNILQSMVEILLFFHPAIWWISRLVRDERENCCDELVLRLQNNKVQYARALLSLETLRMRQPRMAMSSTGGALSRRIRRITGGDAREPRNYSRGLLLGFITVVGLLVLATQTRNVVMASMPAQPQHDTADLRKAVTVRTDGKLAQPVAPSRMKDNAVSPVDGIKVSLLPADFWKTMGNLSDVLRMVPAALDSPITKITVVEDGKEVVIAFDKEGNITSARRDGQVVSDADRARYQGMARQFFRGDADAPDQPDLPMGPLAPMPPMPAMKPMPPMPAMPPDPPVAPPDPPAPPLDVAPPVPPAPPLLDVVPPEPPAPPAPLPPAPEQLPSRPTIHARIVALSSSASSGCASGMRLPHGGGSDSFVYITLASGFPASISIPSHVSAAFDERRLPAPGDSRSRPVDLSFSLWQPPYAHEATRMVRARSSCKKHSLFAREPGQPSAARQLQRPVTTVAENRRPFFIATRAAPRPEINTRRRRRGVRRASRPPLRPRRTRLRGSAGRRRIRGCSRRKGAPRSPRAAARRTRRSRRRRARSPP